MATAMKTKTKTCKGYELCCCKTLQKESRQTILAFTRTGQPQHSMLVVKNLIRMSISQGMPQT